MTKIQIGQVIAVLLLIAFMFYTMQSGEQMLGLFIPIAGVNILLWVLRQVERKKQRHQEQAAKEQSAE